jgi:hypothetical protein
LHASRVQVGPPARRPRRCDAACPRRALSLPRARARAARVLLRAQLARRAAARRAAHLRRERDSPRTLP